MTSELLADKLEAILSPNICPVDWSWGISVGTVVSNTFYFCRFINICFLSSRGAAKRPASASKRYKPFFWVGRNRCVLALICIVMGNKQQLNQLLALCVIFKDERTPKTMKPLPWGFCRKRKKQQLERRMRPLICAVSPIESVGDCTQK